MPLTLVLSVTDPQLQSFAGRCVGVETGLTVGRGSENDLVLPDPSRVLSKNHCAIEQDGGGYVIIDHSTNGVFLNRSLDRLPRDVPMPLAPGDFLQLGEFGLTIESITQRVATFDDLPPPTPMGGSGPDPFDDLMGPSGGHAPAGRPMGMTPMLEDPLDFGFGASQSGPPMGTRDVADDPLFGFGASSTPGRNDADSLFPAASGFSGGGGSPGGGFGGGGGGGLLPDDEDIFGKPIARDDWKGGSAFDHAASPSVAFVPPRIETEMIPDDWDPLNDIGAPNPPPPPTRNAPAPVQAPKQPPMPTPAPEQMPAPRPLPTPIPVATPAPTANVFDEPFDFAPQAETHVPSAENSVVPLPFPVTPAQPAAAASPAIGAFDEPFDFAPPAEPRQAETPLPSGESSVVPLPFPAAPAQPTVPSTVGAFDEPFDIAPPAQSPAAPLPAAPAPRAAAPLPQRPAPARPAAGLSDGAGGDLALFAAFLQGLGVDRGAPTDPKAAAAVLETAGRILNTIIHGLMEILVARASTKEEFRIERTMIGARGNNPLKFSNNPEEAIQALLFTNVPGFLSGDKAIEGAIGDIKAHELAMLAGMQVAISTLIQRFDPKQLEQRIERSSLLDGILPGARKARYWEMFVTLYKEIAGELEDDFQGIFGKEFATAYKAQIDRL